MHTGVLVYRLPIFTGASLLLSSGRARLRAGRTVLPYAASRRRPASTVIPYRIDFVLKRCRQPASSRSSRAAGGATLVPRAPAPPTTTPSRHATLALPCLFCFLLPNSFRVRRGSDRIRIRCSCLKFSTGAHDRKVSSELITAIAKFPRFKGVY